MGLSFEHAPHAIGSLPDAGAPVTVFGPWDAITQLGQRALAGASPITLMDEAVGLVREKLGVTHAAILQLLPKGDQLIVRAATGWRTRSIVGLLEPAGAESLVGYTLASKEAVVVPDYGRETRFRVPGALLEEALVSGLVVVVNGQNRPFGVLAAHSRERRDFSGGDVDFIEALAKVVSAAIEREESERSRARLAAIVESTTDLVATADPSGRLLDMNAGGRRMLGLDPSVDVTQMQIRMAHPAWAYEVVRREAIPAAIRDGAWSGETTLLGAHGREIPVSQVILSHKSPDGTVEYLSTIMRDISERKRAEETIRKERAFFELMVDALPGVFYLFGADGRMVRWNVNFERITGYSHDEVARRGPLEFIAEEDRALVAARIQEVFAAGASNVEACLLSKEGLTTPYYFVGVRTVIDGMPCCIGMGMDVTERKRTEEALRQSEEQLRQAQKMEAIGRLAGGVAHDFNNLLTVITGYGELLLGAMGTHDRHRESVEEIRKAAERATILTRQLLAFSRRQVLQPRAVNVNEIVSDAVKMLGRLIGEDVQLVTCLDPHLGSVMADPGQLEQVITNLAVNARDAMPRGGTLTLETANVEIDQARAHGLQGARPGPHVALTVRDTGCGMDSATVARVFEPFFTTKERGKGTGLGLSTVYGIVRQSGGDVEVASTLGGGTTFRIYLPRIVAAVAAARDSHPRPAQLGGTETVLLVEDEAAVRELLGRILRKAGYRVLACADPADAIAVANTERPIQLVVTDVVMPRMSGPEMAESLLASHPGMRVLFISGYSDEAIEQHGVLEPGTHFLQKPFTAPIVLQKVREVIEAP